MATSTELLINYFRACVCMCVRVRFEHNVQRLVENAQNAAMSHQRKFDDCDPTIEYHDSKEMLEPGEPIPPTEAPKLDDRSMPPINVTIRRVILQENRHFFNNRVNTSMSSVHVPTNVFARGMFRSFYFVNFPFRCQRNL